MGERIHEEDYVSNLAGAAQYCLDLTQWTESHPSPLVEDAMYRLGQRSVCRAVLRIITGTIHDKRWQAAVNAIYSEE